MMNEEELVAKIKSVKPLLEREFSVDSIGYFGSLSKGGFRADSDVDLLVSFNKPLGWKFFDLKEYLENLLNRSVDLVTERAIKKQWRSSILNEVKYL